LKKGNIYQCIQIIQFKQIVSIIAAGEEAENIPCDELLLQDPLEIPLENAAAVANDPSANESDASESELNV
jgi:hypothetical protein